MTPNFPLIKDAIKDHQFEFITNGRNWSQFRCKRCGVYCYTSPGIGAYFAYVMDKDDVEELTCDEFIIKDIIE